MTDLPFPGGATRAAPTFNSISPDPRRSSYASVVSGTAFSPSISGSLTNLLNTDPLSSYHSSSSHLDGRPPRPLSGLDAADMHMNSAWRNMTSPDALPAFSRKYASLRPTDLPQSFAVTDSPSFFTPSYLRDSRYISRLDAAHRAKLVAQQREAASSTSNPPLSASSSNVHLPRMAPSHRGMTYDIIEKEPPTANDHPMPLPTQWGMDDRHDILEISSDGLEVRYTGPQHKTNDHEAAALRADNPMPPQCGIYYFEIKIDSKPKEGMVAIGLSSPKASTERLPGWETESWAYHGDDGKSFFGESQGQGRSYGPTYGVGDTVGCGVNFSTRSAFFTKNGVFLGTAFSGLPDIQLYPSVGMKRQPPVCLKTNFGQEPFVFDIDGMVKHERASIQEEINSTSTDTLQPPLDESTLLQELVAQFLAHDGYVDTAHSFAQEVATETAALQSGHGTPLKKYEVEEDHHAIHRNKIRAAILDGDIDKALKHTNAYYADVLKEHPQIHFKLRCRKFIEMMRKSQELLSADTTSAPSKPNRSSPGLDEHAVFDQEMELDDGDWDDGMDTEEPSETNVRFSELLTEAVQYGQQLRMDYHHSGDEGLDLKMLDEVFSLVCYPDPKGSPHGHYLDPEGRVAVAEELNSAILVSLGKNSEAALERLYQQTEVLVNEISEGGAGAFINVRNDILL
ncbi:SPla/RYanodine receptor SPRY [Penicillium citrinum]|uniref:Protein FYV10 n=2 Tax=Penicillium TaxID=5073 RepID=A0A9W9TQJ8_PENCI|nr:SPla/RYanodine receptor SPRY [Penicillium citrinum]KAJ5233394.1 SPla/RYanodine receptor SPRY [Penicillium citrinum]